MPHVIGKLIDAVNTTTNPAARGVAVDKLAAAITEAGNSGVDIRALFQDALGGPAATLVIGPVQLAAIGEVQRYLANVATGAVPMTPQTVSAIVAQLVGILNGVAEGKWLPWIPDPSDLLRLPLQFPQIPGLDACKFIKCLASSMDCSGPGSGLPGPGSSDDPIGTMVNNGIDTLKRARELAEQKYREAEQKANDLAAAAKQATGAAKQEIEAAKQQAEADAKHLKDTSEQLGQTIGSAIAHGWPR